MRWIFIVSLLIIVRLHIVAQDEIINSKYPYELAPTQDIPDLMPGNYLVRTDADYFNLLNADIFHPQYMPLFPLYNDMGLIMKAEDKVFKVESIVETKYNIIVSIRSKTPSIGFGGMCSYVFIRLRKSDKQILVSEEIEESSITDTGIEYPRLHY